MLTPKNIDTISTVSDQLLIQFFGDNFIALSIKNNLLDASISGKIEELALPENIEMLSSLDIEVVKVAFDSNIFTLVPDELFDENKLGDYLLFNNAVSFAERLLFNPIKDLETSISFAFSFHKINLIQNIFPKIKFYHSFLPFWNFVNGLGNKEFKNILFMQIGQDSYEIMHSTGGQLEYYNRFNFNNLDEFIYYPLFISEQLNLDANKTKIVVIGNTEGNEEYLSELNKYFKELEIVEESELGFLFSNISTTIIPEISSTLYLSQCE